MNVLVQQSINRLKNMKNWSDRLGSDEIHEIDQIVKLLENYERKI